MSDSFVAEIRAFTFNFAPRRWATCDGQLLPISQNTALFSLLGTTYGGDGKSTFALPNLQGLVPVHTGRNQPGPGLQVWDLGETQGSETVTLLTTEMPAHSHTLNGRAGAANNASPAGAVPATGSWVEGSKFGVSQVYTTQAPDTIMAPNALGTAGSSLPHNNMMPYLSLLYCIALEGIFPARN